jgi:DNA mismatch repair protein MutS
MEDPKLTKKIVRREVTRVLSAGTVVDTSLGAEQSNWLASIAASGVGAGVCTGLALMDLSTGEFRATEFAGAKAWAQLMDELGQALPAELLFAEGMRVEQAEGPGSLALKGDGNSTQVSESRPGAPGSGDAFEGVRTKTGLEDWVFTAEYAAPLLRKQLGVLSLDGVGLGRHETAAVAAGALVHYLQKTMQGGLEHIDSIRFYTHNDGMTLDAVSVRNLELVEPLFSGESVQTTLFHTLDACATPMGKRLLRATLLRPAAELGEIEARLGAVGEAVGDLRGREGVRRAMNGLLDMERLLGRVALDSAGPREVMALAATLGCLPGLRDAVRKFKEKRWKELGGGNPTHGDETAINRAPGDPSHVSESRHGAPIFMAG